MKALTSHWQILFFIGILVNYLIGIFLEIDNQSCIELSACQVIRYSILLVVDVGDPVIGTDIFYIEKKGEGIHHIAFAVPDVQAALDEAESKGVKLIDKAPRGGAEGLNIAFLHPKSTCSVLTELCMPGKK